MSSNWVQRGGGEDVFEYNHMAMVERLKNGTLVAAWQVCPSDCEGYQTESYFVFTHRKCSLGEMSIRKVSELDTQAASVCTLLGS